MEVESSSAAVAGASSPVPCSWTKELNKAFETALATYEASLSDRWEKVGALVAGMGVDEVKRQFEKLEQDLSEIESGKAALPDYAKLTPSSSSDDELTSGGRKGSSGGHGSGLGNGNAGSGKLPSSKSSDPERRKGIPWSEDEHRLFLLGLAKFGKGDWRSISRNFVVSRTPTQVASHAQKYFIRLNSMNNKDKRRSSIHDITNVPNDGAEALPPSPGPITGMPSPTSGGHAQWQRAGMHAGGMHDMTHQMGAPMDHSMAGPILIAPGGHVHYGQVPVMPAPMAMQHMAYTMPQSANA